jgi:hypothetical protein
LALHKTKDAKHRGVLFRLWLDVAKMMGRVPGEAARTRGMLGEVTKLVAMEKELLFEYESMQSLNELYDMAMDDYLPGGTIC